MERDKGVEEGFAGYAAIQRHINKKETKKRDLDHYVKATGLELSELFERDDR